MKGRYSGPIQGNELDPDTLFKRIGRKFLEFCQNLNSQLITSFKLISCMCQKKRKEKKNIYVVKKED